LAYKVGDVFLQVTTNAKQALDDLRKTVDVIGEERAVLQEATDVAEKLNKALEDGSKSATAQLKRQLKEILKNIDVKNLELETLRNLHNERSKWLEDEIKAEKKKARQVQILHTEAMRREAAFTDYAGSQAEQRKRAGENVQKSELKNLEGFLSRAMMEHSRFADRLDRRDITRNVIENIRRGVQKGLLISERFHKDENGLQKLARGFGIAGTAFQKVTSHSERAADMFYRLQRIAYVLQSAISVLLGTLGSLAGGLMGLVGVAGAAASSLVAVGSSMLSVVSGFVAARIGFGKIGNAVGQAWQQQTGYNRALQDARRQLQALKFDAEAAALSEQEAALNLERAREELARVQDLPPDSRVRREVELQFQQAELSYRQAKARNKQVREDLAKANKDPMSLAGAAGQDPFAGLTKSQQKFAEYLVGLRPIFTQFRESVASQFLGPLENAFRTVITKVFPTLEVGMSAVAGAMGRGAEVFANALADPKNLELLSKFFTNSVPVIEKFADAMGSAFGGLLAVLEAAAPLTERFTSWIADSAERFEKWAKSGLSDGSLTRFFNLAGDVAASLGDVFGSVFTGIKNIINATFPGGDVTKGAGGVILRWLNGIATGFAAFTSSSGFSTWLEQTTTTATIALSTIGDFLGIMLDVADDPALQQFWEIIRQAVEPVRSMLADGVQAAPALARLVVAIAEILAIFSDSGALTLFMDTLAGIIEFFAGILKGMEPVLVAIGRFHAVILAFTGAKVLIFAFGTIFFGIFEKMLSTLGSFGKVMTTANAQVVAMRIRYDQLQKTTFINTLGMSKMQAQIEGVRSRFKNLGAAIFQVSRAAIADKNREYLLALAGAAGKATNEVKALKTQLDLAVKAGATSIPAMQRAVNASRSPLAKQALPAAGGGGFGIGLSSAVGMAASVAGMFGSGMNSAAAQISGAIGMFGSMIPGIPGMVIGALGGLGAIVLGAVENARLEAKAKLDGIKEIAANVINTQEINDLKNADIAQQFISAGLKPEAAGKASAAISAVAVEKAKTPEALATGLGAYGIKEIIKSLMSQGGADVVSTLSDSTSKKSQDLINSAINVAMSTRDPTSKNINSEEVAAAAAAAISNMQAGGKPIDVFRNRNGVITTGPNAFTPDELRAGAGRQAADAAKAQTLRPEYLSALATYTTAKTSGMAGTGFVKGVGTVGGASSVSVQAAAAALDKAREAYMTNPIASGKGIVLDTKDPLRTQLVGTEGIKFSSTDNTVKLDNAADISKMVGSLEKISTNTGKEIPTPTVYITIDKKLVDEWKKYGG
jgi:hypothetical protein